MTPREMQKEFELEVYRFDSELIIESHIIFYWINEAQDRLYKTRYSGINSKGESFEQSQKRTDDLRTLVIETSLPVVAGATLNADKPDSFKATLPDDYFVTLSEEVDLDIGGSIKRTGVEVVTADTYSEQVVNQYSKHNLHYGEATPLRMMKGFEVELITDGNYSVDQYYLRYLKRPATIVLGGTDCELPEHMHKEIVTTAVRLYLGTDNDPRYNVIAAETQTME